MGAKLGQHFLVDEDARDAIARLAAAGPGARVLEIGPGRGAITGRLLALGASVTAVELDDAIAATLPALMPVASKLEVLNEDFLRLDLGSLGPGPWTVAGNLPYAVGTPILQKLLLWDGWTRAVLMFQKEVAERVVAEPGGADYGLLSLSVRARADAELSFTLPRTAFRPPPKVESAVVTVTRLAEPRLPAAEEKPFWRLAKLAFAQRRKKAAGVLASALGRDRAAVDAAFAAAGLEPDARPERIPFDGWRALARALA